MPTPPSHDIPGAPSLQDIRAAHDRIREHVHVTPVVTCSTIDRVVGAQLFFKCEHLQRAGAFKYRGASNAVWSLSDEQAARGVTTHSSGNHGGALARAARERGIPAIIVVPKGAPAVKVEAIEGYGAQVVWCEPNLADREATARRVIASTGATFIHPYDDPRVIAGQATAAVELLGQVPDLDVVIAPVGGGGLMSGTALAVHALSPRTRVFGGEPAAADDAARSLASGTLQPSLDPDTCADGLRTALSERTLAILRARVERIVTVDEDAILAALRLLWERAKLPVEPSSAVALAAICVVAPELQGQRIGVILSGGNVDLGQLCNLLK